MRYQAPQAPRRRHRRHRRPRLTRRGRVVLITGVLALVAAGVLVPLLLVREPPVPPPPPSRSGTLLIPEGWRASQVYDAVDKALELPPGTTRVEAGTAGLDLPAAARGNPEGFLFPATYPIDGTTTPRSLLRYMVTTAGERFGTPEVTQGSQRTATGLYETITIASIVQAEADTEDDMGKVARVIRNRLARGMPLQMDSTLNYALDRSTLDTSRADTRVKSPYNTYAAAGLPPTPIGNPGEQAVRAALAPPPGDWLYFVTVKPGDTRFTADYGEHLANVEEFNRYRSTTAS
ncbi:endolytic transglycosylase MltG [Streptomyces somaliensis DSM 40738]|uniref:Endolytic murein transglycosylase n=1 Tax=Streptomyces somaliensis (strain ATCC 33201 / DSM 40738 / JCM 12659 / KCTC 9044 / NCTC 11332 / NRRL B-12077 / IP 733) TaxID=1134445 RepID=A0AA44IC55_STRE0|nr:endolytic transglycosylase MltG [Streptomyces somaliensis]MCQ0021741.1 endolytic transglycosylase MltG [Streptomyces somaliensis DSM 40738]NKY13057.1 endolytic transglycosylase MltG [Streptomyces somaliensis DSM 40738]